MVDKAKITYMTKLAVYDKNYSEKDQDILKFFLNDYIYRENLKTRIYALISYSALTVLEYVYKIMTGQMDVFLLDYMAELSKIAINAVIWMALFTVVSSAAAAYRYYDAAKRQNKYLVAVNQLERMSKVRPPDKEDTRDYNGSDIVYKRDNS